MASQVLIEGPLDAKGPKGSEDRKFWKAWCRQWVRFSVVYPGRREPYLILTLSHKSSDASAKEIKLSRDGLRLFRCRSKSRFYRTWAVTSGNKIVLYFAAESEVQAQNWMQAVRDGLWPPCFSFQMLTACTYEVSLIDDDNTFMAGLLGVYGRFVLTSENVISLIHPHWGSTLLEISLDNIIDVLFIREAELSPAGVFSIILKRIEGSTVKNLQFFCNTANDAVQWILSKLYTRRKSFSSNRSGKRSENRVSFSLLDDLTSSKTNLSKTLDHEKTISFDNQIISSQTDSKLVNITDPFNEINLQPEYENAQYLKMGSFKSKNKHSSFDKEINKLKSNNLEHTNQIYVEQFFQHSSTESKNVVKNKQLDLKSRENTYENTNTTANRLENSKNFSATNDINGSNNEFTNQSDLNKKPNLLFDNLTSTSIIDDFLEYAVIDKSQHKSEELHVKHIFATDRNIYSNYVLESDNSNKSQIVNFSEELKETTDQSETKLPNKVTLLNYDSNFVELNKLNEHLHSTVHKKSSNNSLIQAESIPCSVNVSPNDFRNSTKINNYLLSNFPSNFLDTSMNSINPMHGGRGSSSSCEEDNEILISLVNEFDELKMDEQLYEDVLERKGTFYEEIDESGDEHVNPLVNIPELPKRPTNLKIPESLKLQRLSRNIEHTLEIMDDVHAQKEFGHSNFIKKIKDVNRITQLSPNKEYAAEAFKIKPKMKVDIRNEPFLTINALKPRT